MPFNEEDHMHRKVAERIYTNKSWNKWHLQRLLKTWTPLQLTGMEAKPDHESCVLLRKWIFLVFFCYVRKVHHSHISQYHTWIFMEFWNLMVVSCVIHEDLGEMPSTNLRGKQCAYWLVVTVVFSDSVATRLRWGGKSCMYLEARNIRIWCAKKYKHRFKLL